MRRRVPRERDTQRDRERATWWAHTGGAKGPTDRLPCRARRGRAICGSWRTRGAAWRKWVPPPCEWATRSVAAPTGSTTGGPFAQRHGLPDTRAGPLPHTMYGGGRTARVWGSHLLPSTRRRQHLRLAVGGCTLSLHSCTAHPPRSDVRALPAQRPREDGLAHPADTSRTNLASVLGLLS